MGGEGKAAAGGFGPEFVEYFDRVLPAETACMIGKALEKEGLPDGFRRFLGAYLDEEFEDDEEEVALPILLLAMAMKPREAESSGWEPDLEFATILTAGFVGTDRLWERFLDFPGNDRFRGEESAGIQALRLLRLEEVFGRCMKLTGIAPMGREEVARLLESAVMRVYRKHVAD